MDDIKNLDKSKQEILDIISKYFPANWISLDQIIVNQLKLINNHVEDPFNPSNPYVTLHCLENDGLKVGESENGNPLCLKLVDFKDVEKKYSIKNLKYKETVNTDIIYITNYLEDHLFSYNDYQVKVLLKYLGERLDIIEVNLRSELFWEGHFKEKSTIQLHFIKVLKIKVKELRCSLNKKLEKVIHNIGVLIPLKISDKKLKEIINNNEIEEDKNWLTVAKFISKIDFKFEHYKVPSNMFYFINGKKIKKATDAAKELVGMGCLLLDTQIRPILSESFGGKGNTSSIFHITHIRKLKAHFDDIKEDDDFNNWFWEYFNMKIGL